MTFQVDETIIVIGDTAGNKLPVIIHRCGDRYFLQEHCNSHMPIREIDEETAWSMLETTEAMKEILRKSR